MPKRPREAEVAIDSHLDQLYSTWYDLLRLLATTYRGPKYVPEDVKSKIQHIADYIQTTMLDVHCEPCSVGVYSTHGCPEVYRQIVDCLEQSLEKYRTLATMRN